MRRLTVLSLVLASFATPAAAVHADQVRVPHRVPGRQALTVSADAGEWRDRQLEAASVGSVFPDLQRRLDLARAKPSAEEYDFTGAAAVGDLDGDRVGDLLVIRVQFTVTPLGFDGDMDLTMRSGTTGRKRWSHHYADAVAATIDEVKVGAAGKPGLMLASFTRPSKDERALRVVGIDGRTGKHVYDKDWASSDGHGDIQWGGTFDAYVRGGTDVLVGRVRSVSPVVGTELQLYEVQPFALDGATGVVRAVRDPEYVVGSGYTYLTVGDVDGDNRDDFLGLRRMLDSKGVVTAYGVVENEVHWTVDDISIGWYVRSGGNADIVGDKHEDVLFMTWVVDHGLLEIPPYTDGLPLLDGPPEGIRGVLLDGSTGKLQWDRLDGVLGWYLAWDDVNHDRKADVLSVSMIQGDRDGMRLLVVTGGDKVIRKREVTVEAPIGRRYAGLGFGSAGDLDGDRIDDISFSVMSASDLQAEYKHGFVLLGPAKAVESDDVPFYGTLDGGTAERTTFKFKGKTTTMTVADGWHGKTYVTVSATSERTGFWLGVHPGARGACDGLLVYVYDKDGSSVYVLDAATGRVRFSFTVAGKRPDLAWKISGHAPRCRG